jgi:TolB-like protein
MKDIKRAAILIGVIFIFSCASPTNKMEETNSFNKSQALGFDQSVKRLVDQLYMATQNRNQLKVAVADFSLLDGSITELGRYLGEEIITKLIQNKDLEVVERSLLIKIINEHKLSLTGLIDQSTAKELGKIMQVDSIISGTITVRPQSVKVNARIIDTETGKISGAAATLIQRDTTVNALLKKSYRVSSKGSTTTGLARPSGHYTFYEDFKTVQPGEAPPGWLGTEHVLVQTSGNSRYLTPFEKGQSKLIIPNIYLPENFKVEWHCQYPYDGSFRYVYVGKIAIAMGLWRNTTIRMSVNGPPTDWIRGGRDLPGVSLKKSYKDVPLLMSIEKSGNVVRLKLDGTQIALARIRNYSNPSNIIFDFNKGPFKLFRVSVEEL